MSNDYEELRNLLQRYARAADARNVAALRSLFSPDAIIDGARGRMAVAQWLDAMATPSPFQASMHFLGEPLIEFDAAGDAADLDTYAVVYQIADRSGGQQDLTLGIRYLDRVARSASGWRITERVAKTIWTRQEP
jgi:hypothetical protein